MVRSALLSLALLLVVGCGSDDSAEIAPLTGDATLASTPAASDAPAPTPEIHRDALNEGDETLTSGEYLERYEVVTRSGQWLRAEVVSGDFDPYLIVLSPSGEQSDVDDSVSGNTSMTEAVVETDEGGEWTVVVTSYAPGEAGAFELSIEVLDEAPAGSEPDLGEGDEFGV